MADYELRLSDPFGAPLSSANLVVTDEFELDYVLVVNGVGVATLGLPPIHDRILFRGPDLVRDIRLEIFRSVGGGSFVRKIDRKSTRLNSSH